MIAHLNLVFCSEFLAVKIEALEHEKSCLLSILSVIGDVEIDVTILSYAGGVLDGRNDTLYIVALGRLCLADFHALGDG